MKNYLNYIVSFGLLTFFLSVTNQALAGTTESWSYGPDDNAWRIDFQREIRGSNPTTSRFSATVVIIRGDSAPIPAGNYSLASALQHSGENIPNPEGLPVDALLNAMYFKNAGGNAEFSLERLGDRETNFRFKNNQAWSDSKTLKRSWSAGPTYVVEPIQYARWGERSVGAPTTAGGWIRSAASDGAQVGKACFEVLAIVVTAPFRWFQ